MDTTGSFVYQKAVNPYPYHRQSVSISPSIRIHITVNLYPNAAGRPRGTKALRCLKVLKGLKRKKGHPVDNILMTNNNESFISSLRYRLLGLSLRLKG